MNNDELKKKIVGIVAMAICEADKLPFVETAEYIANELISAGIGYEGEYTDLNCSNSVEEMIKMCEDCDFPECRGCEHTYIAVLQIDKLKHRAEVAERALYIAATQLKCRGGIGKGFCRVDECDYYNCNNDDGCVKAHLKQAEKELLEEGNDG